MNANLLPYHKLSEITHQTLRERLDTFYNMATEYSAFHSTSDHCNCWESLVACIRDRLQKRPGSRLRLLEVGAGRTGFGRYLEAQKLRDSVEFHAQDVTRYNAEWLENEADKVFFGDILTAELPQGYDMVFSTYVLEHVTNPPLHLDKIWSLLANDGNGGELFIYAPRYDFPGYLCPSTRHLSVQRRLRFALQVCGARLFSILSRKPSFLIQTDLAAFHGPFYIDADATHWVSLCDLKIWAESHGSHCKTIRIGNPRFLSKNWIIKRLCTVAVQIHRPAHP